MQSTDTSKANLDAARAAGITTLPDKAAKRYPMLSIESLQQVRKGIGSDINSAQALFDALDSKIQEIKRDSTRNADYQRAKIKEVRDAALPAIGECVRTFDARLEQVVGSQVYWQSKTLALSLQAFDADPVKNSTIRLQHVTEFAATPAAVLQLIANNAIATANWPVLWQAYLAGQERAGDPQWAGIGLDGIEIPERTEALKMIEECKTLTWTAHSIYSQASGNIMTGANKLMAARTQQMLVAS